MGFTDLLTDAGVAVLNGWLSTRSYIVGYGVTQADVAVFKALKSAPAASKYPHAARWYKHIASYEDEFPTLPGDASKPYTTYGPEVAEVTINPAKAPAAAEEDDDDVDLFGSDDEEEDAEAARIREERLAEYRKKKEGKPKAAAKSVVTLDVKPWDDETDMKALEESVRSIEKDGLVWGLSKLVAVGFGIKKLQINLVIEDEKISLDDLQEEIAGFEDYVQSSDVVSRHLPRVLHVAFPLVFVASLTSCFFLPHTTGRHAEAVSTVFSRFGFCSLVLMNAIMFLLLLHTREWVTPLLMWIRRITLLGIPNKKNTKKVDRHSPVHDRPESWI
ncbi:Translation elongation factor EF1B/ribosomal protein S6 [Niveomyces insectorum RCEF 264]|uniref:Elongation factor 1-beta n=1 Tax=Niveomyces insectorum RCEF 264 TaxID=1081102 RepID=A0A167YUK6_9HYPO|nr:Translation elongation factor EF1B/ribosomal protein S6 [Niveomyces insectorum RCEF 264]